MGRRPVVGRRRRPAPFHFAKAQAQAPNLGGQDINGLGLDRQNVRDLLGQPLMVGQSAFQGDKAVIDRFVQGMRSTRLRSAECIAGSALSITLPGFHLEVTIQFLVRSSG